MASLPWSPLEVRAKPSSTRPSPDIATARRVSPQQVARACELAQSDVVIPMSGTKDAESIRDSVAAAELELTPDKRRDSTQSDDALAIRPPHNRYRHAQWHRHPSDGPVRAMSGTLGRPRQRP
jgi:diketogulonate reductase-like aldo/keto reductase